MSFVIIHFFPPMGTEARVSLHGYLSVALCAGVLILGLLLHRRKRKAQSNSILSRLPGPRQYFLGNYLNLLQIANRKNTAKVLRQWGQDFSYPPICNLALGPFNAVVLSSPNYIQKVFGSMDPALLAKPPLVYRALKRVYWYDGIVLSSGEKWKSRRKLINPFFKYHSLRSYLPSFNECGWKLVGKLERIFEDSSAPTPISSILYDAALTTVCKTTFGVDFDGEDKSRGKYNTKNFLEKTNRYFEIVVSRFMQPWLLHKAIFDLHPMSRELRAIHDVSNELLLQLTQNIHFRRDGELPAHKSLLQDLIDGGLPYEGIYEETLTTIAAGHESTAGTMHHLLFFLALHPEIQEKCHGEVDQLFENEVGDDGGLEDWIKLQYLEQCVLETLRMVPVFPQYMRQLGAPLALDDGIELPAGTIVGVFLPWIHMNPELYPNPEKFDPDRMATEVRNGRHPFSYMPFSAGPRKCIGAKFAMMEVIIAVAHILRNFTVRTTDRFEDVVWIYKVSAAPETPMRFIFERRR